MSPGHDFVASAFRRKIVTLACATVLLLLQPDDGSHAVDVQNPARARPLFVESAAAAGLDFTHMNGATGQYYMAEVMGAGAALLDYDGDGDLDIFLIQGGPLDGLPRAGGPTSRLFRNDLSTSDGKRTLRFTDVTDRAGVGLRAYGMGAAVGDYDNDGDLDLYVINWEVANALFRNEQNDRNWIKVKCEGTTYDDPAYKYRSTRDAVGSKVRLFRDGKLVGFREVMTANGFCSEPPLEVHFGADANVRYDIEVTFPSGIKVVRRNVPAGAAYNIREDE